MLIFASIYAECAELKTSFANILPPKDDHSATSSLTAVCSVLQLPTLWHKKQCKMEHMKTDLKTGRGIRNKTESRLNK